MDYHPLASLLSPMALAFLLGVVATLLRSDLKFPDGVSMALTIYLLFAIGLKGGAKLHGIDPAAFLLPMLAGIVLCVLICLWTFAIFHRLGRFAVADAAALAGHYGSVSAATFAASLAFLDSLEIPFEAFLPALLAVMEVPAIVLAIYLAHRRNQGDQRKPFLPLLGGLLTGKSVILLLGGMFIGLASGPQGFAQVAPLFDAPFRGFLTLFLLETGLVTGRKLADLRSAGWFLTAFAVVMPVFHGGLGVLAGYWSGLGVGGATVLGTLAASASYIAAPAAMRVALPQANPSFYLTAALAITFPFNVVVGIPLYFAFSRALFGV